MSEEMVHIRSDEHGAFWRPGACGYTTEVAEAGVWKKAEAEKRIAGCGPEKRLRLVPASPRPDTLDGAARLVILNASDLLMVLGAAIREQDFSLVTPELAMRLQQSVDRLRPLVNWK